MGTTANDITAAIAAERRELADLFDALTPAQWKAPSLCAGWRVREVVAHMFSLACGIRPAQCCGSRRKRAAA